MRHCELDYPLRSKHTVSFGHDLDATVDANGIGMGIRCDGAKIR